MTTPQKLMDHYLPPADGFILESFVATTYQMDFEFVEEELLAIALGVRSPSSQIRAFRSELENRLQTTDVSILYDPSGCPLLARLSPRIDPIPIMSRKLHAKITLLMWVRQSTEVEKEPQRHLRLIVGSANLTRQGFRENYECAIALDYGKRGKAPRPLLFQAIQLVKDIAAGSRSPQLLNQLADFSSRAEQLPEGAFGNDDPIALVTADEVVPQLGALLAEITSSRPEMMTVVSPFWPEGETATQAMVSLFEQLGSPDRVDLVCRGALATNGRDWLPEFDADLATKLRLAIDATLFLRPTLPQSSSPPLGQQSDEIGDKTEDTEIVRHSVSQSERAGDFTRALHAKLILIDGQRGSLLYAGSSNCTRRGLAIGGPTNWEAGFIYRLSRTARNKLGGLLSMAAAPVEVLPDRKPLTIDPTRDPDIPVPSFLDEIVGSAKNVAVRFRVGSTVPNDLTILMPMATTAGDKGYRLIFRGDGEPRAVRQINVVLNDCVRCDSNLKTLMDDPRIDNGMPNVYVEVRWNGNVATFPVRFDEKWEIPASLSGRRATESELIEYFLFGRPPNVDPPFPPMPGDPTVLWSSHDTEQPLDTKRILAYFMRQFIHAIPGIEAEINQASYSRKSLIATLRGPTSALELATRACSSLNAIPKADEPQKTSMAVGFQVVEILAAVKRCRERLQDSELRVCFDPIIDQLQVLMQELLKQRPELRSATFVKYYRRLFGVIR